MSTSRNGGFSAGLVWMILLALTLAGGAAWWWLKRSGPKTSYLTMPVTKGDVVQKVTATGALNPVVKVQVGSQISGRIQRMNADYNSAVKEGDIIAQIDPSTYDAVVRQAEGELAAAIAALELAQFDANRARDLRAKNAIAQAELDKASAGLLQAEAQKKIREAALLRAKVDLDYCTIRSPIDGIVISRDVDVGQTVAATLNAPVIFTIANDLAKMQIDANVAEADVGSVAQGQEVTFTVDAFPNQVFRGTVVQVRNAPLTVENVVTYDTVISVDNADLKLKPGMTASVAILIAERKDVLRIGNATLRYRPSTEESPSRKTGETGGGPRSRRNDESKPAKGARTLHVLRPGSEKPEPVQVELGISDGIYTEVLSGLQDGDLVVSGQNTPGSQSTQQPNPFTMRRPF